MAEPRFIKNVAIGVASIGLVLPYGDAFAQTQPNPSAAGRPAAGGNVFQDVALTTGNTLAGRIVDGSGAPIDGAPVALHQGKLRIGETITDKSGTYVFKDLRGGVYRVTSGGSQSWIRVWKENTAPPGARDYALIVTGQNRARGQIGALGPVGALLAGGTASATTAGVLAITDAGGRPVTSTAGSRGPAADNTAAPAGTNSFAAPHDNRPASSMAIRGLDGSDPSGVPPQDSFRPGIIAGDDPLPKIVICAPYSP